MGPPRIGGDHPVVHFRHRTTCVEVERVRWVEWQQDKLLALGQARIVRLRRESALLLSASALRDDGQAINTDEMILIMRDEGHAKMQSGRGNPGIGGSN